MTMTAIPDLWPDDIRVDVIEPIAILRVQQEALSQKTQGLLRVEVRTIESKENGQREMIHSFDLVAPVLNDYRITLMTAKHFGELIYPVLVQSRVFDPAHKSGITIPMIAGSRNTTIMGFALPLPQEPSPARPDPQFRYAATQEEFIKLVGAVLQSDWVRSLIQSLIVRSRTPYAPPSVVPNE